MTISNHSDQTYHIITFGCTFNQGDSLKIAEILNSYNFHQTSINDAKILIFNTCAVKHSTETKILSFIKESISQYQKKYFIIMGCLPFIDKNIYDFLNKIINSKGFILEPSDFRNIALYISRLFGIGYTSYKEFEKSKDKSNLMPEIKKEVYTGIFQISEGCNNQCSYCCTTNARGNLISYNFENLLNQFTEMYSKGIREFLITSQDLGNYEFEGKKLHHLLEYISNFSGDFKIRLGMINPDYFLKYIDRILPIFNDQRFYRFLHIPIQSASDGILGLMKRNYKLDDIKKIIKKIEEFDYNFTFGTDIIVGFPTESENDFIITYKFIEKWCPSVMNISKYTVRPNTLAKKLPQLSSQEIKKRSQKMTNLYNKYSEEKMLNKIGWKGNITINEVHEKMEYPYMGRNLYYSPILIKYGRIGEVKDVVITGKINHSFIAD